MNRESCNSQIADYVGLIFDTFLELRGDRKSGDDKTAIGGLARLNGYKVVVISYQVGRSGKTPKLPGPEGYRKCSRLARLAEAFSKPVVVFIDTPAVPSLPALRQQRVNEAIARHLEEMSCLMTPIIGVIVARFGEFPAIGMCVADRILMLEGTGYSVSPSDGTSANSFGGIPLHLKSRDLLNLNLVHRTVDESPNGNLESTANVLRKVILEELRRLTQIHPEVLVQQRQQRLQYQFLGLGAFEITSGN